MTGQSIEIHEGCYRALRVVGIAGTYSERNTPTAAEPIFADSHGAILLRTNPATPIGAATAVEFYGTGSSHDEPGWIGRGTSFDPPFAPARVDRCVLVLGPREHKLRRQVLQHLPPEHPYRALVDFKREDVRERDELVYWYVDRETATEVRRAIAKVLRQQILDAARPIEPSTAREWLFHLQRAAVERADNALAAALQKTVDEKLGRAPHLWCARLDAESENALCETDRALLREAQRLLDPARTVRQRLESLREQETRSARASRIQGRAA